MDALGGEQLEPARELGAVRVHARGCRRGGRSWRAPGAPRGCWRRRRWWAASWLANYLFLCAAPAREPKQLAKLAEPPSPARLPKLIKQAPNSRARITSSL
jgi:hypothetical protein